MIEVVEEAPDADGIPGYQLPADGMVWLVDNGENPFHDPVRRPRQSSAASNANPFFVRFYREIAADLSGLRAHEHTAQVPSDIREERETAFRDGTLPVLYCSPTMELGVDIAQLNVVNMRNAPPHSG